VRTTFFALSFLICFSLISFCPTLIKAQTKDSKIKVVTSFSILENLCQQIGKDKIEVKSLVERMTDPHDFEPRSKHLLLIKESELFIYNGLGFEPWAQSFILQADLKKATTQKELLELGVHLKLDTKDLNPHVWQNPEYILKFIEEIQKAFSKLRPESQSYFAKNAQVLAAEIQTLQQNIQVDIKKIKTTATLISPHSAFYHLSKVYGLAYLPLANSDHQESFSANKLKSIIDQVKLIQQPILVEEWGLNSHLLNTVAQELRLQKKAALLSDSLSNPDGPGFTIQEFVKFNHRQIMQLLAP
jgi:ABC-type Zn uptake system ZnuABC Zn-binding protein ZnuA